jgi:hypothetical protein
MINITMPFTSWHKQGCAKCRKNVLGKFIPRLYLYGQGYICKECALIIIEECKNTIDNYNKLLDSPQYSKLLVADNL